MAATETDAAAPPRRRAAANTRAPATAPEIDAISQLLDELPADGEVQIHRKGPTGTLEYEGVMQPGEFSLEAVRNTYGGGAYVFRVMGPDGHGRKVYRQQRQYSIAGDRKEPPPVRAAAVEVVAQRSATDERLDRLERMIERQLTRDVEPRNESRTLMELLPLLIQAQQSRGDPMEMAVKIAAMMKDMQTPSAPAPVLTDALQLFEKGLDLGRKMNRGAAPAEPEGPSIFETLAPLAQQVVGVIEKGMTMRAEPAPTAPSSPHAQPAQPQLGQPHQVQLTSPIAQRVQPYLPQLIKWAQQGKNARFYAQLVMDNISDADAEAFGPEVVAPGFVETMFAQLPELRAVYAWAAEFFAEIQAHYDVEEEEVNGEPDRAATE